MNNNSKSIPCHPRPSAVASRRPAARSLRQLRRDARVPAGADTAQSRPGATAIESHEAYLART